MDVVAGVVVVPGPRFKSYQLEENRIKMVCPWGVAYLWMFVVVLFVLQTDVNMLRPCVACLCDRFNNLVASLQNVFQQTA